MTIKVIGAGYGRTGTMSLKLALEQLGFDKCYHMMEVNQHPEHFGMWAAINRGEEVDLPALFEGYQASVDYPSAIFWQEQMAAFPDARVLLSLRDPEKWYESIMNTIYPSSSSMVHAEDEQMQYFGNWAMEIVWNKLFDGHMDDKEHVISVYNAHNQNVIDTVPEEKLLVFDAKEGWEPLCQFLEVPIPENDFPRVNTTEQFQERSSRVQNES